MTEQAPSASAGLGGSGLGASLATFSQHLPWAPGEGRASPVPLAPGSSAHTAHLVPPPRGTRGVASEVLRLQGTQEWPQDFSIKGHLSGSQHPASALSVFLQQP